MKDVVAEPITRPVLGHVHLKVADLARSEQFYTQVLGFEVMDRFNDEAVFLASGGYHHHIALNTWQSKGGTPPPAGHTGLFHTAFLYPTRQALAEATKRVVDSGYAILGYTDHGVSEAVYFNDPDGNGVELYHDRPRDAWPRDADGKLAMFNKRLDLGALLALAS